jgi:hypothetical protein
MNENQNPEVSGTETPAEAEVIPPTAPVIADGWHHTANGFERFVNGTAFQVMTAERFAEYTTELFQQVSRLSNEQINGSDPRLADFWAEAQELADKAGHCQVFDDIAEALGGPSREKDYTVEVTMMVSVPITYTVETTARSAEDAEEYAREIVAYTSASDFEDYADWYSAEADTYSMHFETEES